MKKRRLLFILSLLLTFWSSGFGNTIASTPQISLLTCSPGQKTYELYGHSAIRVIDPATHTDLVYNYGVFDFNTPHFILRFILGKCDYLLCAEPFSYFVESYRMRGSSITEQILNLDSAEANLLKDALLYESQPEHRIYRYNILRSNCTTKAKDIIEANINGEVIYPLRPSRNTFRTMLHHYQRNDNWTAEGADMLLGADVDTSINERDEMFAPEYLMWYFDSAFVNAGRTRYKPLIKEKRLILAADTTLSVHPTPSYLTPSCLAWCLFFVGVLIAFVEIKKKKIFWQCDGILMLIQGIIGILVTCVSAFSVHPSVDSNWLVWLWNPLPLFFFIPLILADRKKKRNIYPYLEGVLLTLFILFYAFIPQDFASATLPMTCLLLSRCGIHLLFYYRYGVTQS